MYFSSTTHKEKKNVLPPCMPNITVIFLKLWSKTDFKLVFDASMSQSALYGLSSVIVMPIMSCPYDTSSFSKMWKYQPVCIYKIRSSAYSYFYLNIWLSHSIHHETRVAVLRVQLGLVHTRAFHPLSEVFKDVPAFVPGIFSISPIILSSSRGTGGTEISGLWAEGSLWGMLRAVYSSWL